MIGDNDEGSIHYYVDEPIDFEQRRCDMKTLMQLCYNVSEFMCKTWRLDTKVFISREGVSFVDDLIPFTNWKLEESDTPNPTLP